MTATRRPVALLVAAGIVFLVLMGLGVWQVQRLGWKTDLIARVDARVAADPVPTPPPAEWAGLTAEDAEYRRVSVQGEYRIDFDALDANGDGYLSRTEVADHPTLSAEFRAVDADNDGRLSREELSGWIR